MEVAFIHNGALADLRTQLLQFVKTSEHPNISLLSSIDAECLILDASVVSNFELSTKGSELARFAHVFYLVEKLDENVRVFCEANFIMPLEMSNMEEVQKVIKKKLFPVHEKANRLFLFIGGDRKAGTSTVVHAVAKELSKFSSRKTLVVSFTRYPNNLGLQLSQTSLDDLKTRIATQVITFSEILSVSETIEQSYQFIGGCRDFLQASQYDFEDLLHFIRVLREQDDYNVLIDVESEFTSAMTIAALKEVHTKFIVLKPLESYYEHFEQSMQQIYGNMNMSRKDFKYVLNCFDEALHPISYLKSHDLMTIARIHPSISGELAENQRVALTALDKSISTQVHPIANLIAVQSGTKLEVVEEKKNLLTKLFKRNKEVTYV